MIQLFSSFKWMESAFNSSKTSSSFQPNYFCRSSATDTIQTLTGQKTFSYDQLVQLFQILSQFWNIMVSKTWTNFNYFSSFQPNYFCILSPICTMSVSKRSALSGDSSFAFWCFYLLYCVKYLKFYSNFRQIQGKF